MKNNLLIKIYLLLYAILIVVDRFIYKIPNIIYVPISLILIVLMIISMANKKSIH